MQQAITKLNQRIADASHAAITDYIPTHRGSYFRPFTNERAIHGPRLRTTDDDDTPPCQPAVDAVYLQYRAAGMTPAELRGGAE